MAQPPSGRQHGAGVLAAWVTNRTRRTPRRSGSADAPMVGETIELMPTSRRGRRVSPYERLLDDAMSGDATLFATAEAVEAEWQIVEPILGDVTPLYEYDPGAWGPPEVERLIMPPM